MSTPYTLFDRRQHLIGELDFTDPEGAAPPGQSEPGEEETGQLPQRIQPETPGHHRIALEMTIEKPEVGSDVELGAHPSLPVGPSGFGNLANPIEHQHWRQRQL